MELVAILGLYITSILFYNIDVINSVYKVILTLSWLGVYFYLYKKNTPKEKNSSIQMYLEALIYSFPLVGIDIFMKRYGEGYITLFYILTIVLFIKVFTLLYQSLKIRREQISNKNLLLNIVALDLFIVIYNFFRFNIDSMKESLNFLFLFNFQLLFLILYYLKVKLNYTKLKLAYINMTMLTALLIIIQAIVQISIKFDFIEKTVTVIDGAGRIYSNLFFLDMSSASVYIAIGAYILMFDRTLTYSRIPKFIGSIIILLGVTLTSARTGLITFLIVGNITLLARTNYKNLVPFNLLGIALLKTMSLVRTSLNKTNVIASKLPQNTSTAIESIPIQNNNLNMYNSVLSNIQNIFDSNGRIELITFYSNVFYENFWFGVGFGADKLARDFGVMMPHLTFLNIAAQGGFIFLLLVLSFFYLIFNFCLRNKYYLEFNIILFVIIGSLFVPEMFNNKVIGVLLGFPYIRHISER